MRRDAHHDGGRQHDVEQRAARGDGAWRGPGRQLDEEADLRARRRRALRVQFVRRRRRRVDSDWRAHEEPACAVGADDGGAFPFDDDGAPVPVERETLRSARERGAPEQHGRAARQPAQVGDPARRGGLRERCSRGASQRC